MDTRTKKIFAFSQFVNFPIFSLASSLQIRASDPTCLAASPAWKVYEGKRNKSYVEFIEFIEYLLNDFWFLMAHNINLIMIL
jgi:hypothetical protein